MDSSPQKGVWLERFTENQIYLKANVMAIQLAFIGIPIILGLAAAALMLLVPTTTGRTAGLIVGTAIFPSLGICWWVGKIIQPTYFRVYQGHVTKLDQQQIFEHRRPSARIQVEHLYHLSANGLHSRPLEETDIEVALTSSEDHVEEGQRAYFICLSSHELIAIYSL